MFKTRKIMSLVLALVMILGLMPSMAARAEEETETVTIYLTAMEDGMYADISTANGTVIEVTDPAGKKATYTIDGSDTIKFEGLAGDYTVAVTPAERDGYTAEVTGEGVATVEFWEDPATSEMFGDFAVTINYVPNEVDPDRYSDTGRLILRLDAYDADTYNPFAYDKLVGMSVEFVNEAGEKISATYNGGSFEIENMKAGSYNLTVTPVEIDGFEAKSESDGVCSIEQFEKKDGEHVYEKWVTVCYTAKTEEPAPADDSKVDESVEESKPEESKVEEPVEESKPEEESKTEEPAEDSKTEEPKKDESKADEEQKPAEPKKTVDELAQEVLDGKWDANEARKEKLTAAGYDYDAVQEKVNELVKARDAEEAAKQAESKKDEVKPENTQPQRETNLSETQPPTGDVNVLWFVFVGLALSAIAIFACKAYRI